MYSTIKKCNKFAYLQWLIFIKYLNLYKSRGPEVTLKR